MYRRLLSVLGDPWKTANPGILQLVCFGSADSFAWMISVTSDRIAAADRGPGTPLSEGPDVFRPGSAGPSVLAQIVGNGLAFLEQITILQGADVDEDVISPSIRRDEAKSFIRVEKLNLARRHWTPPF